jgi:hypothetical protein
VTHPSEQILDALYLDALDGQTRALTATHVETCATCRARVQQAEARRRHFIAHVLPRQLPITRPRRLAWWVMAPALAAALALVVFVTPREPAPSELGIKGGATLQIYASHGDRVIQVHDGTPLQPDDRIRFVLKAAASQHLVIASIDAAGQASIYVPSTQLPDAPVHEVPGSIVLDRTLGPERVFALLSRAPISVDDVRAALRGVRPEAIRTQRALNVSVETQLTVVFEKVKP